MANHTKGEECHSAKLTEMDVLKIRKSVLRINELAGKYGVTSSHIGKILRKEKWKHV